MRKLAIVYLMGGFGNQIFQYSFGKDLEKKGFKVYFDSSNYVTRKFENNTIPVDRELIFSPRFFEFEEVNNNIRNLLSVFNGKKIFESTYSPIRFFNDKNYEILNARLLNKYTGYWQNIELVEPLVYSDLLLTIKNSKGVITDSGGLQKEAYWFNKPLLTLRENTEWTETVDSGLNVLVNEFPINLHNIISTINKTKEDRFTTFGNGNAVNNMISKIEEILL